jgi:hypothetical protein
MGYSNQKAEKINFKPFWSYIDFGKVLKSHFFKKPFWSKMKVL